jgi:CheY-like chemotaxis protein
MASILIADDDPISARYLRDLLEGARHEVTHAADGRAALREARTRRFDLLIADLRMPLLDGAELLRGLRADSAAASRTCRALAMSGEISRERHRELLAIGFEDAVQKPIPAQTVLDWAAGRPHVADAAATPDSTPSDNAGAVLDDLAALEAVGSAEVLQGLRELFHAELPVLAAQLGSAVARGDRETVSDIVHRLRASCRFCGATRLDAALRELTRGQTLAPAWRVALEEVRAVQQALGGEDG